MPNAEKIGKGLLSLIAGTGAAAALQPGEAEAATYPGFVKLFPKLVTVEGRKELRKLGLLDDDGRFYVGTLEPEVYEALKKRDKSVLDDNVWISRHAADRRIEEGVKPEDLAQAIADLIDSKEAKVLPNFPSRYPQRDHARWMLAGKRGDTYTAAPLRTGEFGDVELKTAFEPQYDKKAYLDRIDWGGPRLPFMFTLAPLPWQSIPQLQGLSAVSRPYQEKSLSEGNQDVKSGPSSGNPALQGLLGALEHPEETARLREDLRHGNSYGWRSILEGMLGGAAELPNAAANASISPFTDYRFGNPGKALADAMDLDHPQTDMERGVAGVARGAAEALPYAAGGAGLAKGMAQAGKMLGASPSWLEQFGSFLADNPGLQAAFGAVPGGILGYRGEDEEGLPGGNITRYEANMELKNKRKQKKYGLNAWGCFYCSLPAFQE